MKPQMQIIYTAGSHKRLLDEKDLLQEESSSLSFHTGTHWVFFGSN